MKLRGIGKPKFLATTEYAQPDMVKRNFVTEVCLLDAGCQKVETMVDGVSQYEKTPREFGYIIAHVETWEIVVAANYWIDRFGTAENSESISQTTLAAI